MRDELTKLKDTNNKSKIFRNLVIHDLRSPTSQIKYSIEFLIERILA